MKDKPGMMIYFDRWVPILELDDATVANLLRAAVTYGQTGEEPNIDGVAKTLFLMLKPDIDGDDERYGRRKISSMYAIYCRETKKDGKEPVPFNDWVRTIPDDTESDRSVTTGIGREPITTTVTVTIPSTITTTTTDTETSSNIIPDTTTTTTIIGSPKIEGGECIQDSDIPSPSPPPSSPSWEDKKRAAIEKLFAARGGQI